MIDIRDMNNFRTLKTIKLFKKVRTINKVLFSPNN